MIYVDDAYLKARIGNVQVTREWCHLVAFPPNEEELVEFGKKIGLRKEWLQRGTWVHFDVTPRKKQLAIRHGAIPIESRKLAKKMMDWRRRDG